MGRHRVILSDFSGDFRINAEFDLKTSEESVRYTCDICEKTKRTQKRVLCRQMKQNRQPICLSCKNKINSNVR